MLFEVRDQLDHKIDRVHASLKSEIHGLRSEIHGLKSEIQGVKSEMSGLKSEIHRIGVLVEEQNARNNVVLEGLGILFQRQDKVEKEFDEHKKLITDFIKASNKTF